MITRIYISKLHGYKDIDVPFFKDVTLLVGRNGSGKTTVLNIISSIGSGNIDFLLRYEFEEIKVNYIHEGKHKDIALKKINSHTVRLIWGDVVYDIEMEEIRRFTSEKKVRKEGGWDTKVEEYEILLNHISKELNLLYLPLSRNINYNTKEPNRENYIYRNNFIFLRDEYHSLTESAAPVGNIDETLEYVNKLAKESHRKMMIQYELLNEKMRKRMFQTFFSYDSQKLDLNAITDSESLADNKIQELKNAFKEIDVLNPKFEKEIDLFFTKLRHGRNEFLQWVSKSNKSITDEVVSFMSNISQVDRVLKWQKIVQSTNSKKIEARKQMKTFLDTVNNFLKESEKEIEFDEKEGKLTFRNKYKTNISLEKMSSGEKQIVIFFAYLIFKVNDNANGIFIIDEPELSLHLSWQRRFIKAIYDAAPSLQLIFATHSPEIIGPYRSNCVVLGGGYQ